MPGAAAATLRRWLRPPRRLRLLRPGAYLLAGIFGLGVATLNTGNNLLYLLLGTLLGLIVLSGILSEETLRPMRVQRRAPRAATAGDVARIEYVIRHAGGRTPAFALRIGEVDWPDHAFAASVQPGAKTRVRLERVFARRGVHELTAVTLATTYPFGLFLKTREYQAPATLVVWPRTDRRVRAPRRVTAPGRRAVSGAPSTMHGGRESFRGLRPYRSGDDPRDVHWRSTARAGQPIIREYEAESSDSYWICLDLRGHDGRGPEEESVEIAASLAARAVHFGDRFGFCAGAERIMPDTGRGHLERVLDVLARVHFEPAAAAPVPQPAGGASLLVSAFVASAGGFADSFSPDQP